MEQENPFAGIKTYDNYTRLWQLTGIILLLQVAVSVIVSISGDRLGLKLSPFESILPALLVTGYVSWAMLAGLGVSWRGAFAEWNRDLHGDIKKAFKYLAGYGLILLVLVVILLAAYWLRDGGPEHLLKPLEDKNNRESAVLGSVAAASRARLLLVLFSACVVAPVVEEVFFRRIVYTTLRLKRGFWFSAFWSGLLFAAFHGVAAPLILPVGIYLCWIYERERRLPVNILLHSMVNFVMITLKLFI
ncbi:MAG TPA: hypothetical protein DCS63_03505 [Elusimicrobia bacterium]|nr:hypothetical protein [Elusimicrobiota bacterium]